MMNDPKQLAQISLITLLILGCLLVVYPFLAAVLFAGVVCITNWPVYAWLHRKLGNRDNLAALLMTLVLLMCMVLPTVFLTIGLGNGVTLVVEKASLWMHEGLGSAPDWLHNLPFVGDQAADYWHKLQNSREELVNLIRRTYEPAKGLAFASITFAGNGILQLVLVIFIGFFLYRDGLAITHLLRVAARRLGGALGEDLIRLSRSTVTGVMVGIVGTALAQAVVAFLGFLIAGVPGAILLGTATFFLSMVPIGPPLLWGGAALWLYDQGEVGWAIFMVLYGLLIISSVDNFIKPILISRSASLPILLIALGVFGGILAFGFIGIFLGPTLLALAHALFLRWVKE